MTVSGASPNVVDSSGWIEYLVEGANAGTFAEPINDPDSLIVPALTILEVAEWMLRVRGTAEALDVVGLMRNHRVVDLDADLALEAARLGREHTLPLADSVIYATARLHGATLWTQDADFENVPGVWFIPKQPVKNGG